MSRAILPAALAALAACGGGTEPVPVPAGALGRYELVAATADGRPPGDPFVATSGYVELGEARRVTRVVGYPASGGRAAYTGTDTGRFAFVREGVVRLTLARVGESAPVRSHDAEFAPGELVLRLEHPADGEVVETYRRPVAR